MGFTLPEFRESNGRVDWRQVLDMIIPGNIWDSRANEYRPIGMAAGAASMIGGPLAGTAVELGGQIRDRLPQMHMPQFNNPFAGGGQQRGRAVTDPLRYADDTASISNAAAGHAPGPWRNQAPLSDEAIASLERGMGARGSVGPTPMRGGTGGYNGTSISRARGLGESQRRTSDSIMEEQMAFLARARDRGGALMER